MLRLDVRQARLHTKLDMPAPCLLGKSAPWKGHLQSLAVPAARCSIAAAVMPCGAPAQGRWLHAGRGAVRGAGQLPCAHGLPSGRPEGQGPGERSLAQPLYQQHVMSQTAWFHALVSAPVFQHACEPIRGASLWHCRQSCRHASLQSTGADSTQDMTQWAAGVGTGGADAAGGRAGAVAGHAGQAALHREADPDQPGRECGPAARAHHWWAPLAAVPSISHGMSLVSGA